MVLKFKYLAFFFQMQYMISLYSLKLCLKPQSWIYEKMRATAVTAVATACDANINVQLQRNFAYTISVLSILTLALICHLDRKSCCILFVQPIQPFVKLGDLYNFFKIWLLVSSKSKVAKQLAVLLLCFNESAQISFISVSDFVRITLILSQYLLLAKKSFNFPKKYLNFKN